jgi:hypothetical protein
MNKNKKKQIKCKKCEFYDNATDTCKAKDIQECTEQNIVECEDFLIKDKLVNF